MDGVATTKRKQTTSSTAHNTRIFINKNSDGANIKILILYIHTAHTMHTIRECIKNFY